MRQTRTFKHLGLIGVVAGIVLFTNLGGARLWDRDEPRNAGCAAEMLARGDWVVPWFNDELRTHKPVLLYWLIMSAYEVFGVNEFAARFWSAALGIGTAFCAYALGRRLFDARVGVWGGVILATSLMFDVAARAATPDSTLIFFVTAALTAFVLGTFPVRGASNRLEITWRTALAMYALMGCAVLAKGPVGCVLPTAVVGMFLLIARLPERLDAPTNLNWLAKAARLFRLFAPLHFLRTCWAMRPITAVVVVLAVALPWYLWVGLRTDGEFLRGFFLEHNVSRAIQSREGHAGSSLLFYPVAILIGFFPWSVFAGPTVIEIVRRLRAGAQSPSSVEASSSTASVTFLLCWIGVWVGAFSLAQTKLPSYVTPCYAAFALLTGAFLNHWTSGTSLVGRWWLRMSLGSLAAVGVALLIALPLVARRYVPGEESLAALGLIPLVGASICFVLHERGRTSAAAITFVVAATLFTTALFGYGTRRVDRHQQNHVLLEAISRRSASPQVGAFGCLEPSWTFYGARPVRELTFGGPPSVSAQTKTGRVAVSECRAGSVRHHDGTRVRDASPVSPRRRASDRRGPALLKARSLALARSRQRVRANGAAQGRRFRAGKLNVVANSGRRSRRSLAAGWMNAAPSRQIRNSDGGGEAGALFVALSRLDFADLFLARVRDVLGACAACSESLTTGDVRPRLPGWH